MPDLIARVIQEVQQNVNGTIIGVQTGMVQGDVIDVKIYTFPVGADRPALLATMVGKRPRPYKFLEPYTPADQELFAGRTAEVKQVLETILQPQRLLVIHGDAGVGKTSLAAAGVIPRLMEWGALTIHVQDYVRPFEAIKKALKASAEGIEVDGLDELKTIPELVGGIIESTGGTLFLIFDQFELLFEPTVTDAQRAQFIDALAALRDKRNKFSELLFIIILVRDEAKGKTAALRDRIPEIWKCAIPLLPLSCASDHNNPRESNAFKAIYEPLKTTDFPVSPVDDIIENYIIPDLDALTPGKPDSIHPPYLQIVCQWLYDMGRKREPHNVDVALYKEGNWADGILARYMTDTLETKLKDVSGEAEQLLVQMASPGVEHWVSPGRLQLKDVKSGEMTARVIEVLELLVEAELLVRRRDDNEQCLYALAHPVIRDKARLLGGKEAERRFQAADELERVWSVWLARKELASSEQLRYLSESGTHLTPQAIQALFLLRSATERGEPARLWLKWLRDSDEGPSLISRLETFDVPEGWPRAGPSVLDKAKSLLGVESKDGQDGQTYGTGKADQTFGPVTENAVAHTDAAVRQASALGLIAMEQNPKKALNRMKNASEDKLGWLRRNRRMAELRGALADADPEVEPLNAKLLLPSRFLIWEWRAMRRLRRERARIFWLTAGGAIGAGLGMAVFRALEVWIHQIPAMSPNEALATNLYTCGTLGAALSLGCALADPLISVSEKKADPPAPTSQARPVLKTALVAAALAALFFAFVSTLFGGAVAGTSISKLAVAMSFFAGIGMGCGLCLLAGARCVSWPKLIAQLLVASLFFAAAQFIIINYPRWSLGYVGPDPPLDYSDNFSITWPNTFFYNTCRYSLLRPSDAALACTYEFSIFDAALAGLILTGSTAVGMVQARKYLAKWQRTAAV
jgi:hypothetical protein